MIWSLVRKPGAFARYCWREELFPTLIFRRGYDALRGFHGERADAQYVRILYIAATNGEAVVERALSEMLETGERFDGERIRRVATRTAAVPSVTIGAPDLRAYDTLLEGVGL